MKDVLYLVSSCLLGENCRYDGNNSINDEVVGFLKDKSYIAICPEVLGGLSIPRVPCEIRDGKVIGKNGKDYSEAFFKGAEKSLYIGENKLEEIAGEKIIAILKSKSPSCGKDYVYDGSFKNKLKKGNGIFVKILKNKGIKIFSEKEIDQINNLKIEI